MGHGRALDLFYLYNLNIILIESTKLLESKLEYISISLIINKTRRECEKTNMSYSTYLVLSNLNNNNNNNMNKINWCQPLIHLFLLWLFLLSLSQSVVKDKSRLVLIEFSNKWRDNEATGLIELVVVALQ